MPSTKRKHTEEYKDPDYPGAKDALSAGTPDSSPPNESEKRPRIERPSDESAAANNASPTRLQRLREIIEREFQIEITNKTQQIEEIDNRIVEARKLLDRLRYAIVAEYYRKQEVPLTSGEAAAVRGEQTLFDHEPRGPQMPLHPSIKKIIGKQPYSVNEILKPCPVRAAAQNAKSTIRLKTAEQKRKDRRMQQMIRDEGIVIDHSKASKQENVSEPTTSANATTGRVSAPSPRYAPPTEGISLNTSRLNNKQRHLLVVGNTSKYIGDDPDVEQDVKLGGQVLSHKWLVYVRMKNNEEPLEKFVKKVRFFLHSSYRPNNVVDICKAPFQIMRRGWGEFPIRIQLFFHEHYNQKPIQLMHNIVLDKTLSGLQTMGAETMLEIWLRREPTPDMSLKAETATNSLHLSPTFNKHRTISFTHNKEELDDNLFEFLNNMDEMPTSICADIEKLQPTVMVPVPMPPTTPTKASNCVAAPSKANVAVSPGKQCTNNVTQVPDVISPKFSPVPLNRKDVEKKSPVRVALNDEKSILCTTTKTASPQRKPFGSSAKPSSPLKTVTVQSPKKTANLPAATINTPKLPQCNANQTKPSIIRIQNNNNNNTPNQPMATAPKTLIIDRLANNNVVKTTPTGTGTPTMKAASVNGVNGASPATQTQPKKILQKQIVQLVDRDGKVKYVQMIMAVPHKISSTSTTTSTTTTNTMNSIGSTTSQAKPMIVMNSPPAAQCRIVPEIQTASNARHQVSNNVATHSPPARTNATTQRNVVFQKEGKLYIIDPMQMKLKQQQKKQVSLLKPQVSLLKQQQQQQPPTKPQTPPNSSASYQHVVGDHNYAPSPSIKLDEATPPKTVQGQTPSPQPQPTKSAMSTNLNHARPMPPPLHYGIRQTRMNATNLYELQQKQRHDMEKQFLGEQFHSTRSAVEYLLRRIPLIAAKDSVAAAYPFVRFTLKEFQGLPTLKQRSSEWLRAKHIGRLLRKHPTLHAIDTAMWSTREIVHYARLNAYTPAMGAALQLHGDDMPTAAQFSALVKNELRQEQQCWQYDTLTAPRQIERWVNATWQRIERHEEAERSSEIIDVDGLPDLEHTSSTAALPREMTATCGRRGMLYMGPPERLANEMCLLSDICTQLDVRLQAEEIASGIVHPMAQTALAQAMRIFLEKLVRQSVATKLAQTMPDDGRIQLTPHDIGKVIANSGDGEFDFLTNRHFGIPDMAEEDQQQEHIKTNSQL